MKECRGSLISGWEDLGAARAGGSGAQSGSAVRDHYAGFNVRHAHEKLLERDKISWSYTWSKRVQQQAGLVQGAARRGAYRKRRPLPGMLLFQPGNRYAWLPGVEADQVAIMKDADNQLYSALLVEQGTLSSFQGS